MNIVQEDEIRSYNLHVANLEIDTRGEEDQKVASCWLGIGSEITLARTDLKKYADELRSTEVGFSGVRSYGASKEIGVLKLKFEDNWVDLGVHFVDKIRNP